MTNSGAGDEMDKLKRVPHRRARTGSLWGRVLQLAAPVFRQHGRQKQSPVCDEQTVDSSGARPRRCLVVGLGNPGRRYSRTPHNLGFLVVDRLAERNGIRISRKEELALVGYGEIVSVPAVLAKPQTFMNASGPSVKALLERHAMTAESLILVYDDLALPWPGLRIRSKGSAGGHRGAESVIRSLGTAEFARVRLGIHPGYPVGDGAEFVLSRFRRAQKKELDELLDCGSRAVESLIAEGVEKSMTKFNRRA